MADERKGQNIKSRVPDVLADRYEIVRRVGTGGMADVHLARDTQLGRQVALKIMHSQYAGDPSFVDRFRREAQAAANLQHPNIVEIFDHGQQGDFHYIVMEFIEGRSLKDVIAAEAPLDPKEAARITADVLSALGHAHRAGLVHRDVKPGNILMSTNGEVHVTDFGIARASTGDTMTQAGTILGTAYYLSPEQAQALPLDARSDLYSVGVMLYEMVTGQRPFEGDAPVSIAYKHVREQVRPPTNHRSGLPRSMEAIILTAMQKRPEDRYSSAMQMRRDLEAFVEGREIKTTTPKPTTEDSTQVLKPVSGLERAAVRRPGWLVALALLLLASGMALFTWSLVSLLQPSIGTAEVPDVEGLPHEQAARLIREQGLEPDFQANEPSESLEAGLVTRQDPPPERRIARGAIVRYWVSIGREEVEIPDIVGLDEATAEERLRTVGLVPGSKTEVFDAQPLGTVIGQNPRAGQAVRSGSEVDVTLSKGPETGNVPNVIGTSEAEASRVLANAGFRITRQSEFNETFPEGEVFDQDPQPGAEAETNTLVTIFVSRGPPPFPMPDVIGQTQAEAEQTLTDAGLDVVAESRFAPDPAQHGFVVDQNPLAGRSVRRGQRVTIFVGSA